ncbi:MAG: DNA polymerase III subunit delta', partial [Methylobacterium mesophilicum]|nr:DNA polymerase III subunit delta' [Methylobacterium mesophilicum]
HGSVAAALEMLGGERLELSTLLQASLARLPQIDWRALHRLADRIGYSDEDFGFVCGAILDWLSAAMHRDAEAAARAHRLARYAEIWDRTRTAAVEAEVLNLDKRPVLLAFFADLATLADAG